MTELWDIVDVNGNKTGRLHEKGKPMQKGDYHLSVSVWILNSNGEFLISQRTPNGHSPNMWETTGGSAVAGEDSLTAALRETREELGITLDSKKGQIFKSYTYPHSSGNGAAYFNVWIFKQDVDISALVLQSDETCNAIWAGQEQIKQMIADGAFIEFSYIDELFDDFSPPVRRGDYI
jgi:Isopentenyldiphosphate isomerase